MLRRLGVGWSLTAVPVVSAVLMAVTAVHPSVVTVGIADVLRKVRPIACYSIALHAVACMVSHKMVVVADVCMVTHKLDLHAVACMVSKMAASGPCAQALTH